MTSFVELWVYLSATPLFGLAATLGVYVIAQGVYLRSGQAAWANPVLWSVLVLAGVLQLSGTAYPVYFSGAQFIHFLLGPAVVALGWPLWQRRHEVVRHLRALVLSALAGGMAAACTAYGLGWLMGLPPDVLWSLLPKSVAAPVAMGLADRLGGVAALAAVFAVVTGMIGALSAPLLVRLLRLTTSPADQRVLGFALGTAAHGIGAARAMNSSPTTGAYAGLALGLQVVLASLLLPWLA